MNAKLFNVAVAGATGAVGNQMVTCLEERRFPVNSLKLLASQRSVGKTVRYMGDDIPVEKMTPDSFGGVDIALFSAGGGPSRAMATEAAKRGAVVVDNSSAWRMDPEVPLVVPEVNPQAVAGYTKKGIIANPNCSTIQMVVALCPLHKKAQIRRIVVSTYQAVSGTGKKAIRELHDQTRAMLDFIEPEVSVYPHRIAFNCLPHIDVFKENGYTGEEMKMVNETRKILEDDSIGVTATCVRVPVFYGHSEAVTVETASPVSPKEAKDLLRKAPGVKVIDDSASNLYPTPIEAAGSDLTWVGRIRTDESAQNSLNLWVVSDNIRKGAATNAVQIAELLAASYL